MEPDDDDADAAQPETAVKPRDLTWMGGRPEIPIGKHALRKIVKISLNRGQ